MPDYSKGKIYAIRSHQIDEVYIGSTCQSLAMRMVGHRRDYKRYQNGKFPYITSFEILKYNDAYIELLEEFKCENKAQLHKREGELIRSNDCANKKIEGRTKAEWRVDNKERISERHKQHYEANKEKINERHRQHYDANKERISERHKQYRQDNKEIIKQYQQTNKERYKKYRQVNKERIKAQKTEKFTCECGSQYTACHKSRHMRTKKHQQYIETTA